MCGIVGGKIKKLSIWWDKLSHRGEDSYGVIFSQKEKIYAYRSLSKEAILRELPETDFLIAHNRKASVGGVTLELSHPITIKDDNFLVTVIHNGTKKSLSTVFNEESDTIAIAKLLLSFVKEEISQRIVKKLLEGAGVVLGILYNKEKDELFFLFWKDETRPLHLKLGESLFASEPLEEGEWKELRKSFLVTKINKLEEIYDILKEKGGTKKEVKKVRKVYQCSDCGRFYIEKKCPSCSTYSTYLYRNNSFWRA